MRRRPIGRGQLTALSAAVGLVAAGLVLGGSGSAGSATFRDAAYVTYKHHVKLTGVVVGKGTYTYPGPGAKRTLTGQPKISIRKTAKDKNGKKVQKTVGTWVLRGTFSCVGMFSHSTCTTSGNGKKMKVGSLKGKVEINVRCTTSGANSTSTGNLTQSGKTEEGLTFKKCPSGLKKRDKFKFTLSY
jgi:hypothetical protein